MKSSKKGCGLILSAIILFVVGCSISGIIGYSAYKDGIKLVNEAKKGPSFVTPKTITYTAKTSGKITIWQKIDEQPPSGTTIIEIKNLRDGSVIKATRPSTNSQIGDFSLVGESDISKGESYEFVAKGLPDNTTLTIAELPPQKIRSIFIKGFAAFAIAGVLAIIALILGIIGAIKYFSSDKTSIPKNSTPPPLT